MRTDRIVGSRRNRHVQPQQVRLGLRRDRRAVSSAIGGDESGSAVTCRAQDGVRGSGGSASQIDTEACWTVPKPGGASSIKVSGNPISGQASSNVMASNGGGSINVARRLGPGPSSAEPPLLLCELCGYSQRACRSESSQPSGSSMPSSGDGSSR